MSSYKDLINSIKQELETQNNNTQTLQKEASISNQESSPNDDILSDLNVDIVPKQVVHDASVGLEKIAQQIDKTNSISELVKIAEETGNSDIGNLIKLADAIGDRIADRVLQKLS